MQSQPALDPIGQTARWVAAARALESRRRDRLFDDPYAAQMAGHSGFAHLQRIGPAGAVIAEYLALRTRCLDDLVGTALQSGIRQAVIIAAGLDTRAFRLVWPDGMRVWELDRPEVLALKEQILADAGAQPACQRATLGVDLAGDWVPHLLAAGFDPGRPTVWLVEGVLMYLNAPTVHTLLATLAELSAPGSRLGADIPSPPVAAPPPPAFGRPPAGLWAGPTPGFAPGPLSAMPPGLGTAVFARPGQLPMAEPGIAPAPPQGQGLGWSFGTNDPRSLFATHGWETTVQEPQALSRTYGRPPFPPIPTPGGQLRNYLIAAHR